MIDDPYVYPDTSVLRNRLGIRQAQELDRVERQFVRERILEGIPRGNFDLRHLKAIHHHLFQDLYDWAGQVRTVEISKSGSQFQFRQYIDTGMADIHRRLAKSHFLRGMVRADFVTAVAAIMGDVNYVHPFREGNGRTQLQYLKQLAEQAGHPLDLTKIDPAAWIDASKEAQLARYDRMAGVIDDALRANRPPE